MNDKYLVLLSLLMLGTCIPTGTAGENALDFHDDYYLGFSQGAYYGLLLAGEDYDVAWCMKSELEYEARNLGTGGDFQRSIEKLLASCRESNPGDNGKRTSGGEADR